MASYKKLETGWQYRISYKTSTGQYSTKSGNGYTTKKEAQIAAAKIEAMLNKGPSKNNHKISFKEFFDNWYKVYKEPFIAPKTKRNYLITSRCIYSYYGNTFINQIDDKSYQSFINDYAATRAKETVSKVNDHCKTCFKRAVKSGIILSNPAEDVIVGGFVSSKKDKTKALNEKESKLLTNTIIQLLNPRYVSPYIILISIKTGLRYSEVIGLTWDCLNFNKNTITINKTWDAVVTRSFQPTKNESSNRTITVDKITLSYMKQLHDRQIKKGFNFNNLVFSKDGKQPPSNNSVNTSLERLIKRAGINTKITHHGLRHTHASSLLFNNINIKYISKRLGHANVSITLNIYSHIIEEMEKKEADAINQLLLDSYNECKINAKTF